MKIYLILLYFLFFTYSCTKTQIIERSEIDFTANIFYTPAYIVSHKRNIPCSENPYWEGKNIKLKGFVFQGNINISEKSFFLYESTNIRSTDVINIKYESKDSLQISKLLLDNKDKYCEITAVCETDQAIIDECLKIIRFMIKRPEDLVFK
jgi:hypothetical protein